MMDADEDDSPLDVRAGLRANMGTILEDLDEGDPNFQRVARHLGGPDRDYLDWRFAYLAVARRPLLAAPCAAVGAAAAARRGAGGRLALARSPHAWPRRAWI